MNVSDTVETVGISTERVRNILHEHLSAVSYTHLDVYKRQHYVFRIILLLCIIEFLGLLF